MFFVSNMINYNIFDIYYDKGLCYTFFGGESIKQTLSQLLFPALAEW